MERGGRLSQCGGAEGGAEGVGQLYYGLGASAVDEWKIRLH